MILPTWTEIELDELDRRVFVKSAVVKHGVVITGAGEGYESPAEYMSRRWAVIDYSEQMTSFIIGAVNYKSRFDTSDPLAVHKKYLNGEWVTLQKVGLSFFPLEDALAWPGTPWNS